MEGKDRNFQMASAFTWVSGYYFWDEHNEEKQMEAQRIAESFLAKLTPQEREEAQRWKTYSR
jgi:hypothetical protein